MQPYYRTQRFTTYRSNHPNTVPICNLPSQNNMVQVKVKDMPDSDSDSEDDVTDDSAHRINAIHQPTTLLPDLTPVSSPLPNRRLLPGSTFPEQSEPTKIMLPPPIALTPAKRNSLVILSESFTSLSYHRTIKTGTYTADGLAGPPDKYLNIAMRVDRQRDVLTKTEMDHSVECSVFRCLAQ